MQQIPQGARTGDREHPGEVEHEEAEEHPAPDALGPGKAALRPADGEEQGGKRGAAEQAIALQNQILQRDHPPF